MMRRAVGLVALSILVGCGTSKVDAEAPPVIEPCAGTRTENGDGTTTIACLDGTKELVCTRPDCSGISHLQITGTDLARVSLPTLTSVMSGGCWPPYLCALEFHDNPKLGSISLPALVHANSVVIRGNGSLTGLSLPALTGGEVVVAGSALESLSLPALESPWHLEVSSNAVLRRIEVPALAALWDLGDLTISDNAALARLDMPALVTVSSLTVRGNAVLASMHLPALTTVKPNLSWVEATVDIQDNPVLPQCQAEALLARLVGFTGTARISGNDTAATCP